MTLKDIAKQAGVSITTVSNVINKKSKRVSHSTINKINEIIQKNNYIPNLNARSLSNKSSHIIGVLVSLSQEDSAHNFLEDPYISTMIGIIEQELRLHHYYTMIHSVSSPDDVIHLKKTWNVDGFIFLYPNSQKDISALLEKIDCPIVVFDSYFEHQNIINVSSRDELGTFLATEHLIKNGHRTIAFVSNYHGNPLLTKRYHGYLDALKKYKVPFRSDFVLPFLPTYEDGILAGKAIAKSRQFSAVVTTADISAIGIMEGAKLSGLKIPDDLSVVGYDNLKLCEYTSPKLTSISQKIGQKAVLATELLLERIETGENKRDRHCNLDVELVMRESVTSHVKSIK